MEDEPPMNNNPQTEEEEGEEDDPDMVPVFFRYQLANGNTFIITKRFTDPVVIGQGSYGIVCSAFDTALGRRVAIKRNTVLTNFLYCKRLLRELVILRVLNHENIIKLHHIQRIVDYANFDAIYIVMDLMETDLDKVIRSDQDLTNEHIQYFMYQILRGVKYIHSTGLIHRDLKPQNVLINSNCDIKICDFGLSVSENSHMTHYVVSRWYRSPELVIGERKYGKPIDMWSLGCIFAELILRRVLFPGKSSFDQFMCFIKILGTPDPKFFRNGIPEVLREQILKMQKQRNGGRPFQGIPFEVLFRDRANPEAIDLLKSLLRYDSRERLTIEQALAHPYFAELHDPNDEPIADFKLRFEDYEKELKNVDEVKMLIFKQSLIYNRKELREKFLNHDHNNNNNNNVDQNDDDEDNNNNNNNNNTNRMQEEEEDEEEEEMLKNIQDSEDNDGDINMELQRYQNQNQNLNHNNFHQENNNNFNNNDNNVVRNTMIDEGGEEDDENEGEGEVDEEVDLMQLDQSRELLDSLLMDGLDTPDFNNISNSGNGFMQDE